MDYQICCLLKTGLLEQNNRKKESAREALSLLIDQISEVKQYLDEGLRPYLDEALKITESDIKRNLDKFPVRYRLDIEDLDCKNQSDAGKVKKSFIRWTMMVLKADCIDVRRRKFRQVSLDAPRGKETENISLIDTIAAPTLRGLDNLIAKETNQITRKIKEYIDTDPEGKLKKSHPRKRPECNCQILMQMRLLADPPVEMKQIVKQLQVPSATVYERVKICQQQLQEILSEIEAAQKI